MSTQHRARTSRRVRRRRTVVAAALLAIAVGATAGVLLRNGTDTGPAAGASPAAIHRPTPRAVGVTSSSTRKPATVRRSGTASARTRPAGRPRDLSAAVDYAEQRGMTSSIAVLDTSTGVLRTAGDPEHLYASASIVKTMIAARLLVEGRMYGHTADLALAMITRSDNKAANALYPLVGRDDVLPWAARHYGIDDLGAAPSYAGFWGSTRITAAGLVRFYAAVRADPSVWPWLGHAMHNYLPRTPIGEPNDFGLAAAAPDSAIKNGWNLRRDPRHPRDTNINSTGLVDDDRYAVAILSEGPDRLYYLAGQAVVTGQARVLLSNPGP